MRAATTQEFLRSPVGHYTQGPLLTAWMASSTLAGTIYTGFASGADVGRMRELAGVPFHPALARPYRAIIDCSAVTGIEPAAYSFLVEHTTQIASVPGLLEVAALVPPTGMVGAVALGVFHEHVKHNIPLTFATTMSEAIAIVGGEAHREAIEDVARATSVSSPILALRRLLVEDPRRTLDAVARELKVSTRSLQRACLEANTTFRDEVANARFAFSEQLLQVTDEKIDTIARRAGYASAAAFARRFQQVHGMTPTQFRAKR